MLSPHLDDAVFSLGAYIHHEARHGVDMRVVTVLANDPDAESAASRWDADSGFASARAAARTRREEDRRACAVVGATAHWLPHGDETYGRSATDDRIWDEVLGAVAGCDLLLGPGFPLRHADHAWLAELVMQRRGDLECPVGFYAEQPYAGVAHARRLPATAPLGMAFACAPTTAQDVFAKVRASLKYRSQLRPLGARVLLRAFLEERRRGGELIALPARREQTVASEP